MRLAETGETWHIKRRDKISMTFIVSSSTILFTFFSMLRYYDFFTTNWDFGIMEQMLWTGSHGYLLYESANFVHAGTLSFLEIHSSYIAIPLSYLYGTFPFPITLFLVQSLVVSASIVPLVLIARLIGMSRRQSYLISLLFLLNFAIISAIFYDFHWESFIPVEFFTSFLLMFQKKYSFAAVMLVVGSCTLEVFPFLMVGLALFFIVEYNGLDVRRLRSFFLNKTNRWLFALILLSAIMYVLIRIIQSILIPLLVNQPATPSSVGYYITSLFSTSALSFPSAELTTFYWVTIFFSLGFMPLLYPKNLLMSLPWLINTFVVASNFSSGFGNQYAFIAVPPVFIGFIYGMKNNFGEEKTVSTSLLYIFFACLLTSIAYFIFLTFLAPITSNALKFNYTLALVLTVFLVWLILVFFRRYFRKTINKNPSYQFSSNRKRRRGWIKKFTIVVLFLVVLNIVLSPFNTADKFLSNNPGYWFEYNLNPEFQSVQHLVSEIPSGSQILASDNLFPLIANNANAFSLYWFPFNSTLAPYFPFNDSNLPEYVLVDSSYYYLPNFLCNDLFNESIYGIVSFIYSQSSPGPVYLFKKGYTGNTTLENGNQFQDTVNIRPTDLKVGQSGQLVSSNDSTYSHVLESVIPSQTDSNSENIWRGPFLTLLPGKYSITFSLRAYAQDEKVSPDQPVLYLRGSALGFPSYLYNVTIDYGTISRNSWTNITYHFKVNEPLIGVQFLGYYCGYYNVQTHAQTQIILNYIYLVRQ